MGTLGICGVPGTTSVGSSYMTLVSSSINKGKKFLWQFFDRNKEGQGATMKGKSYIVQIAYLLILYKDFEIFVAQKN